ncbi:MAG: YaiI/YqxD family protein [Gallionellaceae bacterium]|nr:YaiI/YqxD family protein [Gallionellaceae bacterium]
MAAIWVDADACPVVVKEILYRAAQRAGVPLTLVANRLLQVPRSPWIKALQVAHGFDVADAEIVRRIAPGDLVITADIPLAAAVLERGGQALSPRGEPFSPETIAAQHTLRDFMDTLRASGVQTGGPPALSQADRKAFAGHLDRWLARAR